MMWDRVYAAHSKNLPPERKVRFPGGDPMAEIRTESVEDDLCTLYIGEQVVITGLTRAEAEAVLTAYQRVTHRMAYA